MPRCMAGDDRGVTPSCASIDRQRAVRSGEGGSSSAPWSANGMLLRNSWVLSASKAPQPPSLDCRPSIHSRARAMAAIVGARLAVLLRARHGHDDDGGVVEIGVMRVGVLEGPAAGPHLRALEGPVAFDVELLQRRQPLQARAAAPATLAWWPASSSAWAASAVSHTGETQGWQ